MTVSDESSANVATVPGLAAVMSSETTLVHVSTVYAGGVAPSSSSTALADYRDTYELSKA